MNQQVVKFAPNLISGALDLHSKMSSTFLPTAIKFHYMFNLRDLSNIFQVCEKCLSSFKRSKSSVQFAAN